MIPGRFGRRATGSTTPNLTISEVTSSDSPENATVFVCDVSLSNEPVIASANGSLTVLRKFNPEILIHMLKVYMCSLCI